MTDDYECVVDWALGSPCIHYVRCDELRAPTREISVFEIIEQLSQSMED